MRGGLWGEEEECISWVDAKEYAHMGCKDDALMLNEVVHKVPGYQCLGLFSLRLNPCKHCLSFFSPTASVYFSFTLLQFHLLLPIVLSFLHHCSGLNYSSPTAWGF